MESDAAKDRITRLERRVRQLTLSIALVSGLLLVLASAAWKSAQSDILKARALILVDSAGRERVILGAPIPEPPGRIAPSTGMIIRDTAGVERFGLGLFPNGRMGMGFDAPAGKGDDRNRERINIVADENGGASIRFLNRKTLVAGYLLLGADDNLYLQLQTRTPTRDVMRRIGVLGDTVTSSAR
jgi:hypothetical protein